MHCNFKSIFSNTIHIQKRQRRSYSTWQMMISNQATIPLNFTLFSKHTYVGKLWVCYQTPLWHGPANFCQKHATRIRKLANTENSSSTRFWWFSRSSRSWSRLITTNLRWVGLIDENHPLPSRSSLIRLWPPWASLSLVSIKPANANAAVFGISSGRLS